MIMANRYNIYLRTPPPCTHTTLVGVLRIACIAAAPKVLAVMACCSNRPNHPTLPSSPTSILFLVTKKQKSPFLDGFPMRYAVSAGWLRGVVYDVKNLKYNLVRRVPEYQREARPSGAGRHPPGQSRCAGPFVLSV